MDQEKDATISISESLRDRLKVLAAQTKRTMKEVADEALERYLSEYE